MRKTGIGHDDVMTRNAFGITGLLNEGNPHVAGGFSSQNANNGKLFSFFVVSLNKLLNIVGLLVIPDIMMLLRRHCHENTWLQ